MERMRKRSNNSDGAIRDGFLPIWKRANNRGSLGHQSLRFLYIAVVYLCFIIMSSNVFYTNIDDVQVEIAVRPSKQGRRLKVPFKTKNSSLIPERIGQEAIYVSGAGESWERVFWRANASLANTKGCPNPGTHHRAIPLFDDGVAAGPKICFDKPATACTSADYLELDSIKQISAGTAIRIDMPDFDFNAVTSMRHFIMDRMRHSTVSGMVFLDTEHFVCSGWKAQEMYIYRFDFSSRKATIIQRLATGTTPESLDFDGKDLLAVANFREGTQSIYKVTKQPWRIEHVRTVEAFPGMKQFCHGISFYPAFNGSHIIAATTQFMQRPPRTIMVRLWDWEKNQELASWRTENTQYRGYKPQDVTFIDKYNMLVAMQYGNIRHTKVSRPCPYYPETDSPTTHLVHLRLDFNLDDNSTRPQRPFNNIHFHEIQSVELKNTATENLAYKSGIVMMSDQFNDQLHFVALDPTAKTPAHLLRSYTGYHMSHGVAFSRYNESTIGITHYGDNSVIVQEMYPEVAAYMQKWKQEHPNKEMT